MKLPFALLLITSSVLHCSGQDITVHVINDGTQKPLKDIYINLRADCENPRRPNALQQKTDAFGTTVFHAVSIAGEPVCIDLFSVAYAYAPRQLDYVFVSPDKTYLYEKSLNPIITALPAEVTFRVRKRNLGEILDFLFRGP